MSFIKYIAITPLESHWGNPENTIFGGEYCCILGGQENWRAYASPVDICNWKTYKTYVAALNYCSNVAKRLLPIFIEQFENKYSLGMSRRFYEKLIYPWLVQFVQILYDYYISSKKITKLYPNACFICAPVCAPCPLVDIMRFNELTATDEVFNLRLMSDMINYLGYPCEWRDAPPASLEFTLFGQEKLRQRTNILVKILKAYASLLQFTNKKTHYLNDCYGVGDALSVVKNGNGRWIPFATNVTLTPYPIDTEFREQALPWGTTTFERLLSYMVPRYIPHSLCEGLPQLCAWASKQSLPNAGVIATSVGIVTNVPLLVLSGYKNIPLAILEHGGTGIVGSSHPFVCIEELCADRYFSHGSSEHFLPSPYLASICTKQKISPPTLVCTHLHRFNNRLAWAVHVVHSHYHEKRQHFLQNIAQVKWPTIRPYFGNRDAQFMEDLKQEFPKLNFETPETVSMEQVLADSCLLILDHEGSTIPRALSVNTPLLVFGSREYSAPPSRECLDRLHKVGVWHDTPESAAAFYNSLIPDNMSCWAEAAKTINKWWFSAEVQEARNICCKVIAHSSPEWARDWQLAFDQLARDVSG